MERKENVVSTEGYQCVIITHVLHDGRHTIMNQTLPGAVVEDPIVFIFSTRPLDNFRYSSKYRRIVNCEKKRN
jgi:hypothetical protein